MDKVLQISLILRNDEADSEMKLKGLTSIPDQILIEINNQLVQMPITDLELAISEVKKFQDKAKDL